MAKASTNTSEPKKQRKAVRRLGKKGKDYSADLSAEYPKREEKLRLILMAYCYSKPQVANFVKSGAEERMTHWRKRQNSARRPKD